MNYQFLLGGIFLLASCTSIANAQEVKLSKWGHAYYFAFNIERIAGIPEHQINEFGCLYKIRSADFKQALVFEPVVNNKLKYNERDVRAEVVFEEGVYFIDRAGIAKGYLGEYYKIDKDKFEASLVLEKCK